MKPLSKGKPTKKNKRENIKSYKAKPKFDINKMNVHRDMYIWPKLACKDITIRTGIPIRLTPIHYLSFEEHPNIINNKEDYKACMGWQTKPMNSYLILKFGRSAFLILEKFSTNQLQESTNFDEL